ncbi:hypothetical protein K0038_03940 [Pseudomonas syringae]|nr:hypothetical protein [Pseudomonas syringae]
MFGHQTPLSGEHSRLNGCPVSLDHYTREDREKLTELNMQIAKASEILSNLLSRRTEVKEMSGFGCDTYYHIMDVVEGTSEGNWLFGSYLKEKLGGLTYQYDLK